MIVLLFICTAIAAITLKVLLKISTKWNNSHTCLVGKTAIVTGGNTGIGYYTALNFAMRGARVILACRNKEKAEAARNKIICNTGNRDIKVQLIDMESSKSIRKFAEHINATENALHILVNNAGAMALEDRYTADGVQLTIQVNHIGCFLLTNLLIDLLKKSAPSRIVNVSSIGSHLSNFSDVTQLNNSPKKGFLGNCQIYSDTKLCNILFTNELANRLKGTGVTVNSLHPGVVSTELTRNSSRLFNIIFDFFAKNSEEGAQTTIFLAVSDEVKNISGKYFSDCAIASMPKKAQDSNVMRSLWEKSEELAKLTTEEKQL